MVNSNTIKGAAKEAAGNVKAAAGKALGDKSMEAEGNADAAAGKAQKTAGKVETKVKSALK